MNLELGPIASLVIRERKKSCGVTGGGNPADLVGPLLALSETGPRHYYFGGQNFFSVLILLAFLADFKVFFVAIFV